MRCHRRGIAKASEGMIKAALAPLTANPDLRNKIVEFKQRFEQTIDSLSKDRLLDAGYSAEAKERAKGMVTSFERFIEEHKDEITALQILYSKPWAQRLRFNDIKQLAEVIKAPPRSWTPEALWHAYETLDRNKVK